MKQIVKSFSNIYDAIDYLFDTEDKIEMYAISFIKSHIFITKVIENFKKPDLQKAYLKTSNMIYCKRNLLILYTYYCNVNFNLYVSFKKHKIYFYYDTETIDEKIQNSIYKISQFN